MKNVAPIMLVAFALSGCSATTVEPIPGSITYSGQPQSRLAKAPVGSTFTHRLIDQNGRRAEETYLILPDRSLKLISRRTIEFDLSRQR
ncbi:hypothetical protein [Rhizobium sp. 18065]|uniref:hypothetical protein n=1 Tax=Rhizobium sp. 18065 TaxID=2681411 RepID=UPI00135B6DE2|nr:hypothetical protein [Rhizobium sp. 18065]